MKLFNCHGRNEQIATDLTERESLRHLRDDDDAAELLDLEVGEGFKDADGDQWERIA